MADLVQQTADTLLRGGTLLYPTDTIWGIGCDARRADAVEKLYALKERDRTKSMLVLCSPAQVEGNPWLSAEAERPTTYILPAEIWQPLLGGLVAGNLAADDGSLGIRVPRHDFCQSVIHRLGAPLVSTSANLSGRPSPTTYNDIEDELKRRVDLCVPPLPALLSAETRGSRILRVLPDGTTAVLRP
ncbi:MAG: Sua5/YciO/YrdC/YwlC family protein [Bacteroidales bacterium]|nr:Sua5/YciO/YrdC/YwlC family protein [Bacteroidales bacterium]